MYSGARDYGARREEMLYNVYIHIYMYVHIYL